MRVYHVPAKYAPYLYGVLARAIETVERDRLWRDERDPQVRAWTPVPDTQIYEALAGEVVLLVGVDDQTIECAVGGVPSLAPSTPADPHQVPARAPIPHPFTPAA